MSTILGVIIFVAIFAYTLKVISERKSSKTLPWNSDTGVGGGGDTDDNPNKI